MVAISFKSIYSRTVNITLDNIRAVTYPLILLLVLGAVVACGPRVMPNYLKGREELLQRVVTEEELRRIKKSFDQAPEQCSQELFNASIARMHHIFPPFADEFAQTPEVNDGIIPAEAKGTYLMTEYLYEVAKKAGGIPSDLLIKEPKILIEWRGHSAGKTDWEFEIGSSKHADASYMGRVLNVEPVGFEKDDRSYLKDGVLKVRSSASSGDTDGVRVSIGFPESRRAVFVVNKTLVSVSYEGLLNQDMVVPRGKYDLPGVLTIKSVGRGLTPGLLAIKDMVLAGEGDKRCSSALRAMLEKYSIGELKEGSTPFSTYGSLVEFVGPVLYRIKETEKDNFEYVVSWLNDRRLTAYYVSNNFKYKRERAKKAQTPEETFKIKGGVCRHYSTFTTECLTKAGHNVKNVTAKWGDSVFCGHTVSVEKDEKNQFWIVMDSNYPGSIRGPYYSYKEIAKIISPFPLIQEPKVETNSELLQRTKNAF